MGFYPFDNDCRQMRAISFVVVLVVVTATLGVAVGSLSAETASDRHLPAVESSTAMESDAPQPSTASLQADEPNESGVINTLSLPTAAIERSDLRRQQVDLGPAAGFDTGVTTERLATRTIEAELDAAESSDVQLARIDDELGEIESEIIELEDGQRETIAAFSDGEIGPRELIEQVATIHLRATTYRERANMLDAYADEVDDEGVSDSRLQRIEFDLRMLQSPVRAHAVSVLRGDQPASRITIETGNSELTLAAIDDGRYIREVNRQGLRGSGTATLTGDRTETIIQQRYPTLWERSSSWSISETGLVYMMTVEYPDGELRTFLDGVSEAVFIEHKQLPLTAVRTGETTTKTQDGLNVTVDQTYAGGPLRVTVTDVETGAPVDATVTVGHGNRESQLVGTTDETGVVWALSPREPFTITVLGEGTAAAFVDIDPPAPESVTNSR